MPHKRCPSSARAMLVELLIVCPRGDHSAACRFYPKRTLPLSSKLGWVMALSDSEVINTYAAHCDCLKAKVMASVSEKAEE